MTCDPPVSTLFPYTTLFRSRNVGQESVEQRLEGRSGVAQVNGRRPRAGVRVDDRGAELVGIPSQFEQQVMGRLDGLGRSEEHTSELQSLRHLVCRLLLEKKK